MLGNTAPALIFYMTQVQRDRQTFYLFSGKGAMMNAVRQNALRDTVEIIKAHGANPNFNYSRIAKNIRDTYEELVQLHGEAAEEQ
jgi:hypothetical protein